MKIKRISMTEDIADKYQETLKELISKCSLSNGKFDFAKARKIAESHGFIDPDLSSIVNHANSERPINKQMVNVMIQQMNSQKMSGSEAAEFAIRQFNLSNSKSWELAGLAIAEINHNDNVKRNHSIINPPSRGKMHRCNFCWMDVDKTDNGYTPFGNGEKYQHSDDCPYSKDF